MKQRTLETFIYRLALLAAMLQLALVLLSWLWAAAMPDSEVRSLLSQNGIRWFFGAFVGNVASPLLVWLIVMTMAISALRQSGLWRTLAGAMSHSKPDVQSQQSGGAELSARQRYALRGSLGLLTVEVVVMVLLTALPHAILLSVTGDLFPSSFSLSLIPVAAFILASSAIAYGLLSGQLRSLHDVGHCLCAGSVNLMPLLLLYVIGVQLFWSVVYVFG